MHQQCQGETCSIKKYILRPLANSAQSLGFGLSFLYFSNKTQGISKRRQLCKHMPGVLVIIIQGPQQNGQVR